MSARFRLLAWLGMLAVLLFAGDLAMAAEAGQSGGTEAAFPRALETYQATGGGLSMELQARAAADPFNVAATLVFLLAIFHTFAAGWFSRMAAQYERAHAHHLRDRRLTRPDHHHDDDEVSFKASIFHLLGEVEAIFGLWVLALAAVAVYFYSWNDFMLYVGKDREFVEPAFVVVIMAIAASRPVIFFAESLIGRAAALGGRSPGAWWLSILTLAPVLGSLITEPAAITIAALLLARKFYRLKPPPRLAYGTIGLLFVNISVGGTLTHFAAPPVLMVAAKWGWTSSFMLSHFGWKAVVAIVLSNAAYFLIFRKMLAQMADRADGNEDGVITPVAAPERTRPIPIWIVTTHLLALGWTVYTAHFPALFIGGFLFFVAFSAATRHHQHPIALRGPILVGFFLAALVIHGGCQGWWIAPVIGALDHIGLMLGATVLTAFNDNAAITYLAAQVNGISHGAQYAVMAGAITGGGLTVIANAPNPAGQSLLAPFFKNGVSPVGLFLGALTPTIIAFGCFVLLPDLGQVMTSISSVLSHLLPN